RRQKAGRDAPRPAREASSRQGRADFRLPNDRPFNGIATIRAAAGLAPAPRACAPPRRHGPCAARPPHGTALRGCVTRSPPDNRPANEPAPRRGAIPVRVAPPERWATARCQRGRPATAATTPPALRRATPRGPRRGPACRRSGGLRERGRLRGCRAATRSARPRSIRGTAAAPGTPPRAPAGPRRRRRTSLRDAATAGTGRAVPARGGSGPGRGSWRPLLRLLGSLLLFRHLSGF